MPQDWKFAIGVTGAKRSARRRDRLKSHAIYYAQLEIRLIHKEKKKKFLNFYRKLYRKSFTPHPATPLCGFVGYEMFIHWTHLFDILAFVSIKLCESEMFPFCKSLTVNIRPPKAFANPLPTPPLF